MSDLETRTVNWRRYRTLVRVVTVDPLRVVVPGWNPRLSVLVPKAEAPAFPLMADQRVHARVNLGAKLAEHLCFASWEPA